MDGVGTLGEEGHRGGRPKGEREREEQRRAEERRAEEAAESA